MTESIPSRRPAYFALAAIAVVLGFAVVLWPTNEGPDVQPLGDSAASFDDGPNEAEVMLPMPGLEGELGPEEPPQREGVDELAVGIADPLWIQVNDTQGKPAPGRTVAITSTGELPIWLVEEYHETDADGRAVYDRSELRRIAESNDWQEVIIGVWDWRTRGFSVEQTVELSELRQISFVVPAESAILVQLVDLPNGFGAEIESTDGGAPMMKGVLVEDSWWRFQNVPHGHDWVINIVRGKLNTELGMISQPVPTNLPNQPLPGPKVPGEIVRSEYRLSDFPCILGRFVDDSGLEFAQFSRTHSGLRVAAFGARSHQDDEVLKVESLGGGNFVLFPRYQSTEVSNFARLHFDWQVGRISWRARDEALPPAMQQVRSASIELSGAGPSVQLGDVILRTTAPLLEVLVEDERGVPIQGAEVIVYAQEDVEVVGFFSREGALLPDLRTREDGRVQFMATSWEDVIQFAGAGQGHAIGRAPHELGICVEAEGYLRVSQAISPGTRTMRLRLFRSGGLTGSVVSDYLNSHSLSVVAVAVGASLMTSAPYDEDGLFSGGDRHQFRLEKLPVGTVDVHVQWAPRRMKRQQSWPIVAVRGVEVIANQMESPEALHEIQLDQRARWVVIDLGAQAREHGVDSVNISLAHPLQPGEPLTTSVEVVDGIARIPLPIGVANWKGSLDVPGFDAVEVEGLGPGQHSVQLRFKQRIELRLASIPASKEWTLLIGDERGSLNSSSGRHLSSDMNELITWIDGPGTLYCSWSPISNRWVLGIGEYPLEITEADIERGYVVITPPDGF